MEIGYAIQNIVESGGSGSEVGGRVWLGNAKQQEMYPSITIIDFGSTEDCKDGGAVDFVTVSITVYAKRINRIDTIRSLLKSDMDRFSGISKGLNIRTIKYLSYGPALFDEEKTLYSRAIDFEVQVNL